MIVKLMRRNGHYRVLVEDTNVVLKGSHADYVEGLVEERLKLAKATVKGDLTYTIDLEENRGWLFHNGVGICEIPSEKHKAELAGKLEREINEAIQRAVNAGLEVDIDITDKCPVFLGTFGTVQRSYKVRVKCKR